MGVGWVTPSARRRVNHYVIVPSTSLRGHRCTVFNNFVFFWDSRPAGVPRFTIVRIAGNSCNETSKPGAPVLMYPKLDAVLAAADVGCFATYIMKQGGVLVPRKNYLIHTAYEPTVEPGTYSDHGIRIYGIWSPITGKENKICTHVHTWKMVKKAPANPGAESAAQGDPIAAWTRGNNCPQSLKRGGKKVLNNPQRLESQDLEEESGPLDINKLPIKERKAVTRRLHEACRAKGMPLSHPKRFDK